MVAQVVLKKGKSAPIEARHPWVFAGSVGRVRGDPRPGSIVEVTDHNGGFLGQGFYNPRSQIVVRVCAWGADAVLDNGFFATRLAHAAALRERLGIPAVTTAYRVAHSEGDGLPGLVVDRYGDYLVVQFASAGMDQRADQILDA